ncbi:MAG: biotin transporter BioY [Spirochaetota bacterium]
MRSDSVTFGSKSTALAALAEHALIILLGSLAIGALAQIAVPVGPVPVTGQTLGVLAVAVVLGPRRGTLAVALYLAEGIGGMPFFAGGTAGPAVLLGPTAGYLVGFVPATYLVGRLFERIDRTRVAFSVLALAAGTAVIYLFGATALARFVGWERVLAVGVAPFLFGDALKIGIVAAGAAGIRVRY